MDYIYHAPPQLRVFVCQASYGDTLGIELDETPPPDISGGDKNKRRIESKSRVFMLIDGGPATVQPTGLKQAGYIPLYNMYRMLNDLVPHGSKGLNTLVVTHDDEDHMLGIADLLNRLKTANEVSTLWEQGTTRVVVDKLPPFDNIWHNSAGTIVTNFNLEKPRKAHFAKLEKAKLEMRKGRGDNKGQSLTDFNRGSRSRSVDKTPDRKRSKKKDVHKKSKKRDNSHYGKGKRDISREKKRKSKDNSDDDKGSGDFQKDIPVNGYFDNALVLLNDKIKTHALTFNGDIKRPQNEKLRYRSLVRDGCTATRGLFEFKFLGPGEAELEKLGEFFTKHFSTRGAVGNWTQDDIQEAVYNSNPLPKDFDSLGLNMIQSGKNDTSLKNLSSIVFELILRDLNKTDSVKWRGLFTGDASARNIFAGTWDGTPIIYDLIKIGHHGSKYNNYFDKKMVENVRKKPKWKTRMVTTSAGNPSPNQPFFPNDSDLCSVFTGTTAVTGGVNQKHVEFVSVKDVMAYFCNVRAKSYIISASHDRHPNPHLSTLVALIARAVLFPEKDPVRIYLTNPISDHAWGQLLKYWFRVLEYQKGASHINPDTNTETDPDDTDPKISLSSEQMTKILTYANEQQKLLDSAAGRALLGLFPNSQHRVFQFYYLAPDAPYGAIYMDPDPLKIVQNGNEDWLAVSPNDISTLQSLEKFYSDRFAIPGQHALGEPDKPDATKDYWDMFGMGADGNPFIKGIRIPKNPPNSPLGNDYTKANPDDALFNTNKNNFVYFANQQGNISFRQDNTSFQQMYFEVDPNPDYLKNYLSPNNFNFMTVTRVPNLALNPARLVESSPSHIMAESLHPSPMPRSIQESIQGEGEIEAAALPTVPDGDGNATCQNRFPDAGRPNYDAFRKFDIDLFEIPSGDDCASGTQMKIKRLQSFSSLLAYLVENNKIKIEDALNAGKRGERNGHPTLGALTCLLLGANASSNIMRSFPLHFPIETELLDDTVRNPLHWPLELLNISVVDTKLGLHLQNASGIQQVAMRIFPVSGDKELIWVVPNEATLLGKGTFEITIRECIDVTIYWPMDSKRRIVHGKFLGSLPTGQDKKHNIVCEWLMMPEQSHPVVYHIQFADEKYNTAGHPMNILEMMSAFEGVSVNLGVTLADAVVPGLIDPKETLKNTIEFSEPGFTFSRDFKDARDLRLSGVFGKFSVKGVSAWKPFSEKVDKTGLEGFLGKIQIPTPSIRLCIRDFFRPQGICFFFRINHGIKLGNYNLAYELETRPAPYGGRLFEFTFRPVNEATQQPLTIMELLSAFGLDALGENDVPNFVTDAMSSVSLTFFRLGWGGKLSVRLPDYLEVEVRVKKLSIANSLLDLDDVSLRLRIENPGSRETRNFYLLSRGIIRLVGVEHTARLTYGLHPALARTTGEDESESALGPVEFAIQCTDTPLTLGHILRHFWPSENIIPEPFSRVTNEVGLYQFLFKMEYGSDQKKQVVSVVKISLGVTQNRIEILEGLSLIEPTLDITAYYPFDETLKTFMVTFSSMVVIDDYNLLVKVYVAAGQHAAFAVSLLADAEPFPVGAFLKFVSRKIGKALAIPYPESFGALDRTAISDFSLFIAKGKAGKFAIRDFSVEAFSNLKLEMWNKPAVELERVTLQAGYRSTAGFNFTFGAELHINEHKLLTSIGYNKLTNGGFKSDSSIGATNEKGWFITAEYPDDIDLLAIAKKLIGLDVDERIPEIRDVKAEREKGIVIRNLVLTLQKAKSGGGVYISADTDWAAFKHIEFAATYHGTNSWGFCLSMELKDNLLSLVPNDWVREFGEWIEVNNTIVAIYFGKIDPKTAGLKNPRLPPPPGSHSIAPSSSIKAGLAVSTTIKMTEKFGVLKKWIGKEELELEGHISTESIGMSAKIPNKIQLGKDTKTGNYDFEISGRFCVNADQKGVEICLAAEIKFRCPHVTRDLIVVQKAGIIVNTAGGVGFEGDLDGPLHDLFKIQGLEAHGLAVKGVFSVAETGVPEEFGLSGGLSLADTRATGTIAMYFAQRDIAKCYFSGQLTNIDIAALMNFALKKKGLPEVAEEFLGGNVVINNLQLDVALENMTIPQLNNKEVKKGLLYETNLYIKAGSYEWSGFTCIEIHDNSFQFIMMMSPLSFSAKNQEFFRLTRGEYVPAEHHIPTPKGKVDPLMLQNGPIIYISTKNKETPLFISTHLILIGLEIEVYAKGNRSGFEINVPTMKLDLDLAVFDLPCISAFASGSVNVKPNQRASASLNIIVNAQLNLPNVPIFEMGQSMELRPIKATVGFEFSFDFKVGWPNSGTGFELYLKATVFALDQSWDKLDIALTLSPDDLNSIATVVQAAIQEFLDMFPRLILRTIEGKGLNEMANCINRSFGEVGVELAKAVAILSHTRPEEVISILGMKALGLNDRTDVLILLAAFYEPAVAMQLLGRMLGGFNSPDIQIGPVRIPLPPMPDIFRPPKIQLGPITLFGQQAMQHVQVQVSAMKVIRVHHNGDEIVGDIPLDGNLTQDEASSPITGMEAQMPVVELVEDKAMPAEVIEVGEEPVVVEWTQEQIDDYVRKERIALIGESLHVFAVEVVFETSKTIFPDLSTEEVVEYIVKANTEEEKVVAIQELASAVLY